MHSYFCPRCNFRTVVTKHLCPTCGYKIPRQTKQTKSSAEKKQTQTVPNFWSKILGFNFASTPSEKTKSA